MVSIRQLHPWQVSVSEAIGIQERLRERIVVKGKPDIHKVAGVDVGYSDGKLAAAVCIFTWSRTDLDHVEVGIAEGKVTFPYIPGLLTFREGPVILKAFRKLKNKPDVILFDGQGICHPRRMGIATHLGIILDIPTIGCAKSSLCGTWKMPGKEKGSFSFIYDKKTSKKIGAVLRTRTNVRPVFVSPGYKIGLKESIKLILKFSPIYRIPEPLRCSHRYANSHSTN